MPTTLKFPLPRYDGGPAYSRGVGVGATDTVRVARFGTSESEYERLYADPLLSEWETLAKGVGAAPFLWPGWVLPWWRAFGSGRLVLWSLCRKGGARAVLPLMEVPGGFSSASNYHTPLGGLLAENRQCAKNLLRALLDGAGKHVSLAGLDPFDGVLSICIAAASEMGYRTVVRGYERACYLQLAGSWDEYEARLSRNLRTDLRRCRRRLEERGRVEVEIRDGGKDIGPLLVEAFAAENSGWKLSSGTAILSSPQVRGFYSEVARWAARGNMLRLCLLRLDGKVLAMYFALEERGIWHLLKGGYDAGWRPYSPAKVLLSAVLRHCFQTGMERVEFHGNAEPYKLRWNPASRELQRFDAYPATATGSFSWACLALRQWLKTQLTRAGLLHT